MIALIFILLLFLMAAVTVVVIDPIKLAIIMLFFLGVFWVYLAHAHGGQKK